MSKFSPGPWQWGRRDLCGVDRYLLWASDQGRPVLETYEAAGRVGVYVRTPEDARLIAAAPEMYEQLRQQWNRCRCRTGEADCETCFVTRDLLDRIDGKEPTP